jgi:hypothetical protein
MGIPLKTKYNYDPTKSLKVFVGQCAATGNGGGTIRHIELPGIRRVWSSGGCPFVPWPVSDARIPNFGIDVETAVNIPGSEINIPTSYILEQNYPNPFNPSTNIRYALPHASFITLTVYNTLGQQVAQLVNEQQQAGYHDVVFRGDGLASGVYFYRIQAGDFVASKKLLMLK